MISLLESMEFDIMNRRREGVYEMRLTPGED
jgi:hypothetical protein